MSKLIGRAISNYYFHQCEDKLYTQIDEIDDVAMPPSLFFRGYRQMNHLERLALHESRGHVLDVGSGGGCHAALLIRQGNQVTALESQSAACDVLRHRGFNVCNSNILNHSGKYDTILLLMNGFGIAQKLSLLEPFLNHLKGLLNPGGQILGDSTDISYFRSSHPNNKSYFGEVQFKITYQGDTEEFPWLYADEKLLHQMAHKCQLHCTTLKRNSNNAFLVRMTTKS